MSGDMEHKLVLELTLLTWWKGQCIQLIPNKQTVSDGGKNVVILVLVKINTVYRMAQVATRSTFRERRYLQLNIF
jgi:hypothetical protein